MSSSQHPAYTDAHGYRDVDLVPGTVRGYRVWNWDTFAKKLVSTGWPHAWAKGQQQPDAICMSTRSRESRSGCRCDLCVGGRHISPAPWCSCGYYASYDPYSYMAQAAIAVDDLHIHGTVSAHGLIVLGTGGFRAQRIQVDAFWGPGVRTQKAMEQYEVPWFRTREQMIRKFPPTSVKELLKT